MWNKISRIFIVNRVVKYFVFADLILFSGWGLVSPVFSIFVIDQIVGATLVTVGVGAAVFWITRSAIQLPIANFLDSHDGERDDFRILIFGLLLTAGSAFMFLFISLPMHLYAAQFLHGLGMGLYAASWPGIFSRHLDKKRIAFEWSLNSSTLGFAMGITAFLG